jgi:hypothetical protein
VSLFHNHTDFGIHPLHVGSNILWQIINYRIIAPAARTSSNNINSPLFPSMGSPANLDLIASHVDMLVEFIAIPLLFISNTINILTSTKLACNPRLQL